MVFPQKLQVCFFLWNLWLREFFPGGVAEPPCLCSETLRMMVVFRIWYTPSKNSSKKEQTYGTRKKNAATQLCFFGGGCFFPFHVNKKTVLFFLVVFFFQSILNSCGGGMYTLTRWWWFQILLFVHPYLGKWSNSTSIFFKWVVQPPTSD